MTTTKVGAKLDTLLWTHDLTQAELAERMGVARQTINHLVTGRYRLTADMALKLERALQQPSAATWLRLQLADDLAAAERRRQKGRNTR